jgi:PIN domain nuclease of toxin-antitoxin system
MKVLLDTHTFLWWITDSELLSRKARDVISNRHNIVFFSAASGWEIAIKMKLGKLTLQEPMASFIIKQLAINSFEILPCHLTHALQVYSLAEHHRDPFDRMLIAQSQLEDLPLLSSDPLFARYPIKIIW